jgi:hypothetical protein
MDAVFLYFLKANGLLALFFVAYYVMLQKETFFNSNRWYLLLGLFTSALLPLFSYTKIIYVDPQTVNYTTYDTLATSTASEVATFDWFFIGTTFYVVISLILFFKIVLNLFSVLRLLSKKKRMKNDSFSVVNLTENLAPFSFFNYIAINPNLYTAEELESILLHEKVHSKEKHSADILLANLFCVLFWFNPFMWWYKKAIIQNLEYIADQKAVKKCQNKTHYQKALLRVVTNQNYLSITNHFNQSLIKKRIVMLNTNQSKKQNTLKYLFVVPVLICFVIFFQMEVIAKEKATPSSLNKSLDEMKIKLEINKNTTDAEMKKEKEVFKKEFDTDLKFSKVKRNSNGEITSIKVDVKANKGKSETYQFSGSEPIKPFVIYASKDKNGVVSVGYGKSGKTKVYTTNDKSIVFKGDDLDFDFSFEMPDMPDLTDLPNIPDMLELEELAELSKNKNYDLAQLKDLSKIKSIIVHRNNDQEKAHVIINGKVIQEPDLPIGQNFNFSWSSDEDATEVVKKLRGEALAKAKIEIEKAKPEIERAKIEILRSKDEIKNSKLEMEHSKKEIELAKIELEKAKIELEKARLELEKARQRKD